MTTTTPRPRMDPKSGIPEFTLLLFIFLQLLTGLVEATYAFGLLSVEIPAETIFVLFLLSPLLLFLYPRVLDGKTGRVFTLVTILLAEVCWVISLTQPTRGKMIFCGLGVGAGMLALAGLVRRLRAEANPLPLGEVLAAASLASIGLRAISSGNDFFLDAEASSILSAALVVLFTTVYIPRWIFNSPAEERAPAAVPTGAGRAAALCLGLFSVLVLVYFGFATPAVIARWTGGSYPWITLFTALPVALLLAFWPRLDRLKNLFNPRSLLAWNLLFVLALALTLGLYSVPFPCCVERFPFEQTDPGLAGQMALYAMLLLHPVIYLDFGLLTKTLGERPPTARALAGGFSLGAFALTLLIFANIFTSVYDYMPGIGPLFRDRYALVMVFPAALLALAMWALFRGDYVPLQAHRRWGGLFYLGLLALGASLVLGLAMVTGPFEIPIIPAPEKQLVRVQTYNIQQGYSAGGQKNFHEQANVLRKQGAQIIGLQESDTARIAGGNSDVVRYFADQLHMYSYYGPRTTSGTFGVALLSSYPIQDARTFYMYSTGEQTAAILAKIVVKGKPFTVLVTHLGNNGPLIQQQQVLERLSGQENVIAMGDFNFRTDSEAYRQSTAVLQDGWLSAELKQVGEGQDASQRIDHIFVSPGTRVNKASYLPEGPSDHPGLVVEISW